MKKTGIAMSMVCFASLFVLWSCKGGSGVTKSGKAKETSAWEDIVIETTETVVPATTWCPEYTISERTQYALSKFKVDKEGFYVLFDGKNFNGWRGYNRVNVPTKWVIDDGAMRCIGKDNEDAAGKIGGDLIFGHKFKNFELSVDWKVSKGANSGIFYLGREIKGGALSISAPESQVLDNENHPDAKKGVNNNRKSSSLYDMLPAKPQNAKPFGEWNNTTIIVSNGKVIHRQNGVTVLEYRLWTPQWVEMLQNSKFSKEKAPRSFDLLSNCGGPEREGYIGFQDHGDEVWYRNVRIKVLN